MSPLRLRAVAALAAVTSAMITAAACAPAGAGGGGPRPIPPTVAPATSVPATPPPGPDVADHSVAGARRAGLRYLGLSEAVLGMEAEAAAAAQRQAATAASADRLVAELQTKLAALHQAYPSGVAYRVGPVATRVTANGPDAARVEIYYVGVLSAPGVAPYEEWRLARYDLVWERGAWRVAAESSGPGPRPTAPPRPEPVGSAELDATLGGFTGVAGAS